MKLALASCATLADFEKTAHRPALNLSVSIANFGVIDASGGAAYYETGNYGFKKIDANDPALAPDGYLIRTNHSFTGAVDQGMGYIRYAAASEALNMAAAQKKFEPQYLLNNISRNLNHSLTKGEPEGRPAPRQQECRIQELRRLHPALFNGICYHGCRCGEGRRSRRQQWHGWLPDPR